jgi:glycosyltransferase involved in cell wall biosynthesis
MRKLKILISAYACSPNQGSEPGMGWNFVHGLSQYHEVHVISEKRKWEIPVCTFLNENPSLNKNLIFYFIDKKRNKWLRKIWPPSYYWFYKIWQKEAYHLAMALDEKENFDLIHQLNMVGYREPGFLWKMEKPYVWGPIGGLENSPWNFLPKLGFKGMIYYGSRNVLNSWQRNFSSRPRFAANKKNNMLIAATPGNARLIQKIWHKNSEILCEVGQEAIATVVASTRTPTEPLKIVWSGQHTPGKNLPLLLEALTNISFPFELNILGNGPMTKKWRQSSRNLKIESQCTWYGWLERKTAIKIMKLGHVFCITSIKDLTSTVTLEALSYGLPIICLDHCGFAHVVTDKCGIRIPVVSPANAMFNFTEALTKLYNDEELRQQLSHGALQRAMDFSWDRKIEDLNRIYSALLIQKN